MAGAAATSTTTSTSTTGLGRRYAVVALCLLLLLSAAPSPADALWWPCNNYKTVKECLLGKGGDCHEPTPLCSFGKNPHPIDSAKEASSSLRQ